MSNLSVGKVLGLLFVGGWMAYGGVAEATTPSLVSAAARKFHNLPTVGLTPFDNPLTAAPNVAIECRAITGNAGLMVVMTFDQPVIAAASTAAITGTAGALVAAPVFNGNTVSMTLSGLADQSTYTLTVNNVSAADASGTLPSASIPFRTLLGDVNSSGTTNVTDIAIVKSQINLPVTAANFRCDVNANGLITISDVAQVKLRNLQTVPGGGWTNTAPTISTIADQAATSGIVSAPIGFTVSDAESPAKLLYVTPISGNQTLLPNANIVIGGSGASRTITVAPAGGQVGSCQVNLLVSDGILNNVTSFNVTVTAASTLYIATLTPESNHPSTGAGTATLQVAADGTRAVLRFQYSNLTSPKVAEHLHHGGPGVDGPIIFDIDTPSPPSPPTQQADGSYLWIFDPVGSPTPAEIVSEIAAGNYYINVHTVNFAGGEIRGQFNYAAGSQVFTAPAPAPPQPTLAPTANDISRFLTQATFGPTLSDLSKATLLATANTLTNGNTNSYDAWLNNQFAIPTTSIYGNQANVNNPPWTITARAKTEVNNMSPDRVVEAFWHNALTAPDQLRQRVAFAYSEIFVISSVDENIAGQPPGMANYHDLLANDAFANFRTILDDVTFNPMMGQYLSMRGNNKQTLPARPNENYAREIMQLFSIGLNLLQPDGSLKLDATGLPIPSYNQSVIEGFAQLFTGYDIDRTVVHLQPIDVFQQLTTNVTGTAYILAPYNNFYHSPLIPSNSGQNHSYYQKDLLSYSGNYTIPAGTGGDRYFIADIAPGSQTVLGSNDELKRGLDNVFNHPNVGAFISRQLIQRLIGSTPSPAFVYRVAGVFNDDGTAGHVRGNMQAVIKAILTDYEARAPQSDAHPLTGNPGYGHLREPVLRLSAAIRGFHPVTLSGYSRVSSTDSLLAQTPYRAPTVFNFFPPDFSDPGVVAAAFLTSPELLISNENTNVNYINLVYAGIYNAGVSTNAFSYGPSWPGGDLITHLETMDGFTIVNTTTTALSATATAVHTVGLVVGQTVHGAGIPPGTTVTAIAPNTLVLLSHNAQATNASASVTIGGQALFGATTNGNPSLVVPGTTAGLVIGQSVTGTGIAAGTVVANIATANSAILTLSQNSTISGTSGLLYGTQVVTANTVIGQPIVSVAGTTGLVAGQAVSGVGIPLLTYISAVDSGANTVTLSQNAAATGTGINLLYSAFPSEVQLGDAVDISASPPIASAPAMASPYGLLDRLSNQFMGGLMPTAMKTRIATYVNTQLPRVAPTTVTIVLSQNPTITNANAALTINGTAVTCAVTNGNVNITAPIGTANLTIGQSVTGTGIMANTTIANITAPNAPNALARARAATDLVISSSQYSTEK